MINLVPDFAKKTKTHPNTKFLPSSKLGAKLIFSGGSFLRISFFWVRTRIDKTLSWRNPVYEMTNAKLGPCHFARKFLVENYQVNEDSYVKLEFFAIVYKLYCHFNCHLNLMRNEKKNIEKNDKSFSNFVDFFSNQQN